MMNIYNGNVTTDHNGDARVGLPRYCEAFNTDFRYQPIVIGQFAKAIVTKEIEENTFEIKTDKPNVKVSWQVTGVRNDALAKEYPLEVEKEKPEEERSKYLHPELFDQPEEKGIHFRPQPQLSSTEDLDGN